MKISIKSTFYLLAALAVVVVGYIAYEKFYTNKSIEMDGQKVGELKDEKKTTTTPKS